ncbi:MAG: hypothetical protein ACYTBR_00885 [Planctomycetota bacterium]
MIQAAGLLGLALLLCSCHEGPRGSADGQRPVPVSYAALAEAHNARVDRISRVYADGSIELRWTDEDGRHFAPGNVDLWIEPPARTAIHISKGGERIMWLGSDGPTAWLFDFRSDPTVLHVVAAAEGGTSDLPLDPGHLFGLCGLTPLPAIGSVEGFDEGLDAYTVVGDPAGGPLRMLLDRETLLPVGAEILDDDGEVALYSRLKLRRYERVDVVGAAPGSGPMFPTLIDIHGIDGGVHAKLSVYSPTDDRREIEPHYFDLDWLIESFRPGRIEGRSPVAAAP